MNYNAAKKILKEDIYSYRDFETLVE